jgi:dTDP-4-amino-4,6-dideoxygalactose transaminase
LKIDSEILMENQVIPFSPPFIDDSVIDSVLETLKSGWITSGPKVKLLENEVSKIGEVSNSVCVNSWTSGAILVLKWFGVKQGDEVVIPAYTYSATALAVLQCGAIPVMVDVTEDFTIDVDQVEKAITPRTKVIIPVDFGGWPPPLILKCFSKLRIPQWLGISIDIPGTL